MGPLPNAKEYSRLHIAGTAFHPKGFVLATDAVVVEANVPEAAVEGEFCVFCVGTDQVNHFGINSTIVIGNLGMKKNSLVTQDEPGRCYYLSLCILSSAKSL